MNRKAENFLITLRFLRKNDARTTSAGDTVRDKFVNKYWEMFSREEEEEAESNIRKH